MRKNNLNLNVTNTIMSEEDEERECYSEYKSTGMFRKGVMHLLCLFALLAGLGITNAATGFAQEAVLEEVYASTSSEDEIMEELEDALANAWDAYQCKLSMSDVGLGGQVTAAMFEEAYTNVINDNYQYFYLPYETTYTYSVSDGVVYVGTATFVYSYSGSTLQVDSDGNEPSSSDVTNFKNKVAAGLKKLESAIDTALDGVDSSWSDLEKVLYIHDYLTRLNEYDNTYSNYSMYNALVDNTSVCQGYALAFRYLVRQCGIECELVSSSTQNHVWNAVKINGKYYMVDVTYDDPTNPDRLGRSNHKYFLKSYTYMMADSDHYASDWTYTGDLTASSFSSTYYDSYFWDDVTTGFEYVNGTWYGLNGSTIYSYTCNGTDMTQKSSILTISTKWKVWGTSSSYWSGCYASLASYEDALYYSTCDSIYMYVPSTGKTTVIYQLESTYSSQGYIYGMRVLADGTVEFYLATSPNNGGSIDVYSALMLPYEDPTVDLGACTISLSTTSYTYSGSAKKPTVTVKYNGANLTKGTDYTVSYSNNTNAGTATVTITGKGNYTGTVKKTFTIKKASQTVTAKAASSSIIKGNTTTITASGKGTITYSSSSTSIATVSSSGKVTGKGYGTVKITVKAAGNSNYNSASTTVSIKVKLKTPSISSISNTSTGLTIKWGSVSGAVKYRVYRRTSTSKSWTKLADTKSTSYTDKTAKNGTRYYYTVCCITSSGTATSAYSSTGKNYYRLTTPTLSSISCTAKKTLTIKYKKNSQASGYQVQYSTSKSFSSIKKTYTITKNSTLSQKITGLTKGKTYYVRVRAYKTVSSTKYYSGWLETSKKVTK